MDKVRIWSDFVDVLHQYCDGFWPGMPQKNLLTQAPPVALIWPHTSCLNQFVEPMTIHTPQFKDLPITVILRYKHPDLVDFWCCMKMWFTKLNCQQHLAWITIEMTNLLPVSRRELNYRGGGYCLHLPVGIDVSLPILTNTVSVMLETSPCFIQTTDWIRISWDVRV